MYDLHCHSNLSDGILRPEELVSRAKAQGVTTIALTDHDTLMGVSQASQIAQKLNVDFVAGIELSCLWRGMGIHVVGLNFDPDHAVIQEAEKKQWQARQSRAVEIAEKLKKCGFENCLEGAEQYSDGGIIGRPHFARYLVESGYVKSQSEAFKRYLGAGKPGDVKQLWPDISTAVEWIRASGGVAVLAHPNKYKMTRTKLRSLIELFVESGGQAIEVISGKQTSQVTNEMALLADRYQLWSSCGSDFHVPDLPWQELGCFGELPKQCEPVWNHW